MNREQTKYTANYLSNLSIGIIVVGAITTILDFKLFDMITLIVILASSLSGIILLISGSLILRRLRDEPKR